MGEERLVGAGGAAAGFSAPGQLSWGFECCRAVEEGRLLVILGVGGYSFLNKGDTNQHDIV